LEKVPVSGGEPFPFYGIKTAFLVLKTPIYHIKPFGPSITFACKKAYQFEAVLLATIDVHVKSQFQNDKLVLRREKWTFKILLTLASLLPLPPLLTKTYHKHIFLLQCQPQC
jgi:hypothetical protein